jgi:pimeloyl-ACP methyl ester carboxylesterase
MSARAGGRPVPLDPEALADAHPGAGGRTVVFLHGLMETEFAWRVGAGRAEDTYATHLALLNHPKVYERMLRWLEP